MPPEGTPAPPESGARRPASGAHFGIHAIRRALGLDAEAEARVRTVGSELAKEVPHWVDSFYARILTDSEAMEILSDDARVIRLKRSLHSWFHELFTLPWDEDFERRRERIGNTHVSIQMPTRMMLTSMAGVRQDVVASILTRWDHEPEEAQEYARAVSLALDMELTLMLIAYRRRDRAVARQKDRMVYAQRAARRLTDTLYDRVDAALCYLELARADESRRAEWHTKLRDVLRGLARFDRRIHVQEKMNGVAPRRFRVADLCNRALAEVGVEISARVTIEIEPPELEAVLVGRAVRMAIEELTQNSARHAPGGSIRIRCWKPEQDALAVEVTDEGPGWAPSIRSFRDIYTLGSGLGLSFCELVAEMHGGTIDLFEAPGGGAGVRLILHTPPELD